MNIWKALSQVCIFLLIYIAMVVAVRIYVYGQAWGWIISYWVVLTVKNVFDFLSTQTK